MGAIFLCVISLCFLGNADICEGRVGGLKREDEASNRALESSLSAALPMELLTDRIERILESAIGTSPMKAGLKASLRSKATASSAAESAVPKSPPSSSTSGLSVPSSDTVKVDAAASIRRNFGSILGLVFACLVLLFALMLLAATCLCGRSRGSMPPTIQLNNMEMGKPAKGGLQMGEFDDSFSDITLTPRTPAQAHTRGNGGGPGGFSKHIPGFGRKSTPMSSLMPEMGGGFLSSRRLSSELATPVHMYTLK